jgi:hypothetical protein
MSPTSDQSSPPPMPGWVRVSAIVAAILALVVVIALIWFPGKHGPGRHIHGSSHQPQSTQSATAEDGGQGI